MGGGSGRTDSAGEGSLASPFISGVMVVNLGWRKREKKMMGKDDRRRWRITRCGFDWRARAGHVGGSINLLDHFYIIFIVDLYLYIGTYV